MRCLRDFVEQASRLFFTGETPMLLRSFRSILLWSLFCFHASGADAPREQNYELKDIRAAIAELEVEPKAVTIDPAKVSLPKGGHLQGVQTWTAEGGKKGFVIHSGSSDSESYLVLTQLDAF
jgi:hypothetical protein